MSYSIERAREVLRAGLLPQWDAAIVAATLEAIEKDDPRLVQGSTCTPPPLMCVQDWPVEAVDILGIGALVSGQVRNVAEAEEVFARSCFEIDKRMGEAAACRWLLNWWDSAPRPEVLAMMREELIRWRGQEGPACLGKSS